MKNKIVYNLLLLLGGKSTRFHGEVNKVYCLINHKPVFLYSLDKFLQFKEIEKIIIVYNKDDLNLLNEYLSSYKDPRIELCIGGEERYDSVINGLKKCHCDKVIVHDGARPNVSIESIKKIIDESVNYESVTLGYPVTDTIKKVSDNKLFTIDRSDLFTIQTPQITDANLLLACLKKVKKEDKITDDLMAIEKYSDSKMGIVLGNKDNIKLTSKQDLDYLSFLLGEK